MDENPEKMGGSIAAPHFTNSGQSYSLNAPQTVIA